MILKDDDEALTIIGRSTYVEIRGYAFELAGNVSPARDQLGHIVQKTHCRTEWQSEVRRNVKRNLDLANFFVDFINTEAHKLSVDAGVYFFATKKNNIDDVSQILYVGNCRKLRSRMKGYGIFEQQCWQKPYWEFEDNKTNTKVNECIRKILDNHGHVSLWFAQAAYMGKDHLRCAVALEKEILGQYIAKLPLNKSDESLTKHFCAICTVVQLQAICGNNALSAAERFEEIQKVLKDNAVKLPKG